MTKAEEKVFNGQLQGTDVKIGVAKGIWDSTNWPQKIYDMPNYWLNMRRTEKTKATVAFDKFKEAGSKVCDNYIPVAIAPNKRGEPYQISSSTTIYVASSDPDYPRCLYDIEISMMTGKAAKGFPTDPWYGKKFKPLANLSVSEIRKAVVISAPKKSTKASKAQVVKALNLVPTASAPHSCACKDCKALDALAHANAVIDKLIK